MRYLVLSDIHGGSSELEQALAYFEDYKCDYIVLLGDLLNHGPRNRVPASYQPPKTADLLNAYSTRIISIRGNCDSEVDSMMFNFPCNAPYGYILVSQPNAEQEGDGEEVVDGVGNDSFANEAIDVAARDHNMPIMRTKTQRIFLTHGHLHKIDSPDGSGMNELRDKLGLRENDIVLSGHTHVAGIFMKPNGLVNINPGSTTIPKGGTKAGFALILEDHIELRSLDNQLVDSYAYIFS